MSSSSSSPRRSARVVRLRLDLPPEVVAEQQVLLGVVDPLLAVAAVDVAAEGLLHPRGTVDRVRPCASVELHKDARVPHVALVWCTIGGANWAAVPCKVGGGVALEDDPGLDLLAPRRDAKLHGALPAQVC